jgi:hypothetical protein
MNLEEYLAAPPLEQTEKLLGATTAEEQAFCRWFAEHGLVQGKVVEFGPWLGSLTIPTALGLSKNTRVPPGEGIETYDLFRWNEGFENWVLGTPYEGRCKPGDSYLPLFEEIVAPYVRQGMVRAHAEDLAQACWTGQPIEFLINDAWKAVPVMSQTIREFFPSLSLGAVVFHQDYLWSSDSFIHIGMFHLRDCFEFVGRIQRSCTALFREVRDIPTGTIAELASRQTLSDFTEEEVQKAFEWSKSLFWEPEARLVVDAGRAWMLHNIGRTEAARSAYADIKRSDHYGHPFYRFQEETLRRWGLGSIID